MVATVADSLSDPVYPALETGSFDVPPAGEYLGVEWSALGPGANGALTDVKADLLYAAARIQVPSGRHLIARADTIASLFVLGGHRQPGDFYASKKLRVPLTTRQASSYVVARALGWRGVPEVELWTTSAELYLNTEDVTAPDLVVGNAEERWLGVAVLNLLDAPVGSP